MLRAAAATKQGLAAAARASSCGVPDLHLTPQQIRAVSDRNYSEDAPDGGFCQREPVLPQRPLVPEADLLVGVVAKRLVLRSSAPAEGYAGLPKKGVALGLFISMSPRA